MKNKIKENFWWIVCCIASLTMLGEAYVIRDLFAVIDEQAQIIERANKPLSTVLQIQQLINNYGYGIEEDGICGPITRDAWTAALFDQAMGAAFIDESEDP